MMSQNQVLLTLCALRCWHAVFTAARCHAGGRDGEAGAEMALVVVCARTSPVRCGRWYCNIGAPQARRANVM